MVSMEFPKEYGAPKVQNLTEKSQVLWGQCVGPGNSVSPGDPCNLGGNAANDCAFGSSATASCLATGGGFA